MFPYRAAAPTDSLWVPLIDHVMDSFILLISIEHHSFIQYQYLLSPYCVLFTVLVIQR